MKKVKQMKNMRISTFAALFAAGVLSISALNAQEPGVERPLERQVDVSRDFVPDVEKAPKLPIQPNMVDTAALRPDLDYEIRPTAWSTVFGVRAINPVRVDAAGTEPLKPFYFKAGGGFPGQSIFDAYATTTGTNGSFLGGYINHYGQYAKIKNDNFFKEKGTAIYNSAGLFWKIPVSQRFSFSGEVGYDYDFVKMYGETPIKEGRELVFVTRSVPGINSFSTPRASIILGNDFTDWSFFNFRIGAEGYLLSNRNELGETGADVNVELGGGVGAGRLKADIGYNGRYGRKDIDIAELSIFKAGAAYYLDLNKFSFGLGGQYAYTKRAESNKSYFLPHLSFSFNPSEGAFIPYFELNGKLRDNSYYALSRNNPYIFPGVLLPYPTISYLPAYFDYFVSQDYEIKAGLRGALSGNFSYDVHAGYSIVKDPVYYYGPFSTEVGFGLFPTERTGTFNLGVSLEARFSGSFSGELAGDYYNYSMKEDWLDYAPGMPEFTALLGLKYKYLSKLVLRAGARVTGTRYFLGYEYGFPANSTPYFNAHVFNKQKAVADIYFGGDYFLRDGLGVFLEANNLANQKLYPFNHYPGQGINVNLGVKLAF